MINESRVLFKELLEADLFINSKILTNQETLFNPITSTNVMLDVDVLNWISQEGQVILTTGQMFKTLDLEAQGELIKALSQKRVAALLVKVKPYIEEMPAETLAMCNAYNIAVLDLDYNISFTEVFSVVYQLMYEKQTNILKRVETLHKDMMNVVVSGGNIDDVLRSILKTIPSPVFICDYYFEDTYYVRSAFEKEYQLLHDNIEGIHLESKNAKLIRDRALVKEEELERLIIPIFVKNQVYGHIVAYGKQEPITHYDQLGLEAASNIIALEFLKKISVQEVENKYKVEFFDDLVSLDEIKRQKAVERAQNFRFSENGNYVMLNIHVSAKSGVEETEKLLKASYLAELICKDMGRVYMILNKGEGVYILLMLKEGEDRSVVGRYAKGIYEVLKLKLKKQQIKIGVGRIYKGLSNVYKSLQDASKAAEGAKHYMPEDVVAFEDMGVYKVLSHQAIKAEAESFLRETIEPLMQYDSRKDTELVKTLEVYFQCNGNLKKMSDMLYTHYNTILYRLTRIQEIIPYQLEDEEQRYALQTALKVHKILKNQP